MLKGKGKERRAEEGEMMMRRKRCRNRKEEGWEGQKNVENKMRKKRRKKFGCTGGKDNCGED
jgi:hypothetical protein